MEAEAKPKTEANTNEITISKEGALNFENQSQLAASARLIMRMKLAPDHLVKDGIEAVMSALMFCKQFNLPLKAMNQMAYIKGKLTCFSFLIVTLAERHENYGEFEEFFLDDKQEVRCAKNKNLNVPAWAAIYRVKRKGSSVWNEYKFTMDDAKTAGLLSNPSWQKYPDDMMMHKSRSRALNANYASAINGAEYYEDIAPDLENIREANPTASAIAEQLNSEFEDDDAGSM